MDGGLLAALVALVVAFIGASASILAAYVGRQAQNNTKAVGNGFAHDVTQRLDNIEGLLVAHLNAHADHDLKRH